MRDTECVQEKAAAREKAAREKAAAAPPPAPSATTTSFNEETFETTTTSNATGSGGGSKDAMVVLREWCQSTGHSTKDILLKLSALRANKQCFDSGRMDNTWASVPFGIYLSYDCSSQHRNMGVHISFVQSVKLDKWSPQNVLKMVVGGNGESVQFNVISNNSSPRVVFVVSSCSATFTNL